MSYKEDFEGLQSVFKEDPEQAKAVFHSSSRLVEGLMCEAASRDFSMIVDEPEMLGGTDKGPNPVELVLSALGTCQEITYRLFADKMEIPLTGISVDVSGDIDLRGFFAVDEGVRAGYGKITADVKIESTASDEDIARLREVVNAHCPVLDMLSHATPVSLQIENVAGATSSD